MTTNNLLPLPLKPSSPLPTLAQDLLAFLHHHSQHTHPDHLRQDALDWERVREAIYGGGEEGVPGVGEREADELTSYYHQLTFVSTKLPAETPLLFPFHPLLSLPSSSLPLSAFPSYSISPARPPLLYQSIEVEKCAALWNLAAIWAGVGARRRRGDEEGIKGALGGFQHAAGLLSHLLLLLPRLEASFPPPSSSLPDSSSASSTAAIEQHPPSDLSRPVVECWRELCLAQAQEVAWQKGVMDRLKNGTIAKLALKVSEYYHSSALAAGRSTSFVVPADLVRYLEVKKLHFEAVAMYRRSLDDLGAARYGDELGRLSLADEKLREAAGVAKKSSGTGGGGGGGGVMAAVVQDLKSLQKIVSDNLARATKDNNLIYLSFPTPPSSLPPILSASIIRPTLPPSFTTAPAALRGREWLRQLVPKEVGEVLRLWEDRKREWLEGGGEGGMEGRGRRDEGEVQTVLTALNLPASLDALYSPPLGVPPSLLEKSQTLRAEGGAERLEVMMKDVRRVAGVGRRMWQESIDLLSTESTTNLAHLSAHGSTRWTRPSSAEAAKSLRERLEQLGGFLDSAGESDGVVRGKFGEWEEGIRGLEGGEASLASLIPSASPSSSSSSSASPSREATNLTRLLRAALDSLSDLSLSRAQTLRRARTAVEQADIRERVLREAERLAAAGQGGGVEGGTGLGLERFEEVLRGEMERLTEGVEGEMERLRAREEDLIGEVKSLHTSLLSSLAPPASALEARSQAIQYYEQAFAKFGEMKVNLQEGLRFYAELGRLLGEVRDSCKSFNYTRLAEAQDLAKSLSAPPSLLSPSPSPTAAPTVAATLPPPVPFAAASSSPPPPPPTSGTPRTARTASSRTRQSESQPQPSAPATPAKVPRSSASASSTPLRSTRASTRIRNSEAAAAAVAVATPQRAGSTRATRPVEAEVKERAEVEAREREREVREVPRSVRKKEKVVEKVHQEPEQEAEQGVGGGGGGEWTPDVGIRFA